MLGILASKLKSMKITKNKSQYLLLRIFEGEFLGINVILLNLSTETQNWINHCIELRNKLGGEAFSRLEFEENKAYHLFVHGEKEFDKWFKKDNELRYLHATEDEVNALLDKYYVRAKQTSFSLHPDNYFRFSVVFEGEDNNQFESQTWAAPISAISQ